jgi:hypothetical protein
MDSCQPWCESHKNYGYVGLNGWYSHFFHQFYAGVRYQDCGHNISRLPFCKGTPISFGLSFSLEVNPFTLSFYARSLRFVFTMALSWWVLEI